VQGPSDPAPLHPNAAGELAIALADQQSFPTLSPSPVQLPAPTPSPSTSVSPALG
jgi:hypothetical protein